MNNIEWTWFRGDTCEKMINISGWNKEITQMYFTMKKEDKDKDIVLQKKLGNGIVKISNEETESYLLTIDATDTDELLTDYGYVFDIEIVSNSVKRTIVKGTITLTTDITQTINEVSI